MPTYIATYDLNTPGKDYKDVLETIKSTKNWARLSKSSYAFTSPLSASDVFAAFKPFLDSNDHFYIVELAGPYAGQGPKEVNDWLAG